MTNNEAEIEFDTAPSIPLTEQEIQDTVAYVMQTFGCGWCSYEESDGTLIGLCASCTAKLLAENARLKADRRSN